MTSADLILIPALSGEPDITEAEKTWKLAGGLARAARRQIPAFVLLNKMRRTTLARHASAEIERASIPRLDAALSDLVAYGELSYGTRLPTSGSAHTEVAALVAELRARGHVPSSPRNAVMA
jgi:chromosome partitioning protein